MRHASCIKSQVNGAPRPTSATAQFAANASSMIRAATDVPESESSSNTHILYRGFSKSTRTPLDLLEHTISILRIQFLVGMQTNQNSYVVRGTSGLENETLSLAPHPVPFNLTRRGKHISHESSISIRFPGIPVLPSPRTFLKPIASCQKADLEIDGGEK